MFNKDYDVHQGCSVRGWLPFAKPSSGPPPSCPSSGLVGWWKFDESSGTSAADSAGSNTGTLTAGAVWQPSGGVVNGALLFDYYENSWVDIPNSASLDISGTAITVAMWVKLDGSVATNDQMFLLKPWTAGSWSGADVQYGVEYDGNGAQTFDFYFGDTGGTRRGPFSIPRVTDAWTHIAFTYDGSNVKGYLNGALNSTTAATQSIQARGTPLTVGIDTTGDQNFTGLLDEIGIYNVALSAQDVADLYSGGAGCE